MSSQKQKTNPQVNILGLSLFWRLGDGVTRGSGVVASIDVRGESPLSQTGAKTLDDFKTGIGALSAWSVNNSFNMEPAGLSLEQHPFGLDICEWLSPLEMVSKPGGRLPPALGQQLTLPCPSGDKAVTFTLLISASLMMLSSMSLTKGSTALFRGFSGFVDADGVADIVVSLWGCFSTDDRMTLPKGVVYCDCCQLALSHVSSCTVWSLEPISVSDIIVKMSSVNIFSAFVESISSF